MNRRMVFFLVGQILKAEAALLALPLIVSLLYKESGYLSFLITVGIYPDRKTRLFTQRKALLWSPWRGL